jgi:hypothetical protein
MSFGSPSLFLGPWDLGVFSEGSPYRKRGVDNIDASSSMLSYTIEGE